MLHVLSFWQVYNQNKQIQFLAGPILRGNRLKNSLQRKFSIHFIMVTNKFQAQDKKDNQKTTTYIL